MAEPKWNHSLLDQCGCYNPTMCIGATCCSICYAGDTLNVVPKTESKVFCAGEQNMAICMTCCGCSPCAQYAYCTARGWVREQSGMPPDAFGDFIAVTCCGPCSVVQQDAQLRALGVRKLMMVNLNEAPGLMKMRM